MQMAAKLYHVKPYSIGIMSRVWESFIHHDRISRTAQLLGEKVLILKEQKCSDLKERHETNNKKYKDC